VHRERAAEVIIWLVAAGDPEMFGLKQAKKMAHNVRHF